MHALKTKRTIYFALVGTLFAIELIASMSLLAYLLIDGKTSEMVINIFDFILEISVFCACIVQVI